MEDEDSIMNHECVLVAWLLTVPLISPKGRNGLVPQRHDPFGKPLLSANIV